MEPSFPPYLRRADPFGAEAAPSRPTAPPQSAPHAGGGSSRPQQGVAVRLTCRGEAPGRRRALTGRLRLLESDNCQARTLLGELSARLLSIDSEEHLIVVTFRTFEEIWKFQTYYSLAFPPDDEPLQLEEGSALSGSGGNMICCSCVN
uniref:Uncharacterized protein n=1 Tax=Sphaerodactylus townsendi TaxID=933632 RepID=A0ACB8E6L5_9SAUR